MEAKETQASDNSMSAGWERGIFFLHHLNSYF